MFVLSELRDSVEIRACSLDKTAAVLDRLKQKYCFKLVDSLGLAVYVKDILEIIEFEIKSEILVVDVIFEVIFFKFCEEEVCCGKIVRQEEEKIILSDSLSNTYEVLAYDLFENCEFESIDDYGKWIWNYKGNQLPFVNSELVRFKIKRVRNGNIIEAAMNEPGLGPLKWWD